MSRPLFVGSYLQVTGGLSANEKEGKHASNDNNCCGASVASEQQHKQDLRRIYKRKYDSRIHHFLPECIAPFLPECIAPSTRMHCASYQNALRLLPDCATNNTRGCDTVVLSSFFALIAVD